MEVIREAIDWLKRHVGWLILVLVGAGVGAALYRRKSSRVASLEDALAAKTSLDVIKKLQAEEAQLKAVDRDKANEILKVNARIAEHKRKLVQLHSGASWDSMTDAEVKSILKELGL